MIKSSFIILGIPVSVMAMTSLGFNWSAAGMNCNFSLLNFMLLSLAVLSGLKICTMFQFGLSTQKRMSSAMPVTPITNLKTLSRPSWNTSLESDGPKGSLNQR